MKTKFHICMLLFAGLLLLTGCSSISTRTQPLVGEAGHPPTDKNEVEILSVKPTAPYVPVGRVVVDTTGSPSRAKIEEAIRKDAARLGADAAFVVQDQTRTIPVVYYGHNDPWNWDWREAFAPEEQREIVALAIKYTNR